MAYSVGITQLRTVQLLFFCVAEMIFFLSCGQKHTFYLYSTLDSNRNDEPIQ